METGGKTLITGGAGFVGSHLARRLLAEGEEIVCLDNLRTGKEKNIADLLGNSRFSFVEGDVRKDLPDGAARIYNLASPASPPHYQRDPVDTFTTNVMGMQNVLEYAKRTGAKVVQASTSEIYGDPLESPQKESYWGNVNPIGTRSCYDEGKRAAETLSADHAREYGTDVRIARIFNTYGPAMDPEDGRVVSNFIVQALHNEPLTIYGDGGQTRAFQYIDDLIGGLIGLMRSDKDLKGAPVNLGNPRENTVKELAELVLRMIPESKSSIEYRPLPADDPRRRCPDIARAKEILGWEPKVSLEEGLLKTIAYFRQTI